MKSIVFFDTEIDKKSKRVLDIGSYKVDGNSFHNSSITDFINFLKGTEFACGHNIFNHDLKYIGSALGTAGISSGNLIDTLYLSPLLFPTKPYHALLKDDKLQTDDLNNPLNDSIKAKDLFFDEITAFKQKKTEVKNIFYLLLKDSKEFQAFFRYIDFSCNAENLEEIIQNEFKKLICNNANLSKVIKNNPIELAYTLSLIHSNNQESITPPWVLRNYPIVEHLMFQLTNTPCLYGCDYCDVALDIHKGLKNYFGFDEYRKFGTEPLQEKAVKAAIHNKSLLAVFPTGGGKSITFQVPALMSGENSKSLTVVISPLQSLMKDQVDNLEKNGISSGVTINGLLDPIERSKSFERVEDGSAHILYISPESLRSRTIERLVLGRKISRFVIDEAHCFSSWGQDFRPDYQYIGDFIKLIQEKKNLEYGIPVSCFTATAKQKVIEDIQKYFKDKLLIDLEIFTAKSSRHNLKYQVFEKDGEEEKYQTARNLIEGKACPTIIYVSRTKKAYELAKRLNDDGFNAKPYHGKMDVKEKTANQNSFINGETQIMVATSAFGMGVDKKDVEMVIHYEISDSLENYVQEAGRAGRDENITADCFVLYNEEDLSKHFILLNQTKLSIKEIQQIWKAIKEITKFRSTVSNSALEIARKAGWDDQVVEIETRVKTALAALENAGYLKRGQNIPRIYANSILTKNAQEAIIKINSSIRFDEKQKEKAVRIIKKLFSTKSRKQSTDDVAESRIDYISDHLGIVKEEVIRIINLLREENILADTKDLTAYIKKGENVNRSLKILEIFSNIENFLLPLIDIEEKTFNIKELNQNAEDQGFNNITTDKIKTVLNFWAIKNWVKRKYFDYSKNHLILKNVLNNDLLKEKTLKRHEISKFIVEFLYEKSNLHFYDYEPDKTEILINFSVHELKNEYTKRAGLLKTAVEITIDDIEDALFYLSRIESIKIEGGFLVVYNRLTIERKELDNKKSYKIKDYENLNQFYENKIQQIHIVGEYAKKMISDYKSALQFVEDYFQLNYSSFLHKYFKGNRQKEITRNLTPSKFRQLFGELSPTQLKIINDNDSQYIAVAAGPGSGKTRVLVHKLASLLLMEDVKHEQLLMLTFSRSAATEFKKRLLKLIGNAASFIEIKTFHSYCFDLLGKIGSIEKSDEIINTTVEKIKNNEVESIRITKTVLVIDEAQDMDENEYNLIISLMENNEEMRLIAVGDDDQNIYEFRKADSKFLRQLIQSPKTVKHELIENYRSKNNLVQFTNYFVEQIQNRLKKTPIISNQHDNGKIKIIHYKSDNLVSPIVKNIINTELIGTTCVLTKTNEEALQITGLLLKNNFHAKLIQTNSSFNLYNLAEIRYFLHELNLTDDIYIINDEAWKYAKDKLNTRYRDSSKIDLCLNLINDFEATNTHKKYKSDLEFFIKESKLEDFYNENGETIFVSTIHKSKGKEFDNVFLMLENFVPTTDESKRQLYVALTRAKKNLIIHLNKNFLNNLKFDNLENFYDDNDYLTPEDIAFHLTHKDVWLDYFISKQYLISQLISGEELTIRDNECLNSNGQSILKFSKQFTEQIESLKEKQYELKSAKVNFIIYWAKEDSDKEIKIVLPELRFSKEQSLQKNSE